MRSSVLRSRRAIHVQVEIMRAFVRLRQIPATHKDLARKLEELEKKYAAQFRHVFEAIQPLMEPPVQPNTRRIGFGREREEQTRKESDVRTSNVLAGLGFTWRRELTGIGGERQRGITGGRDWRRLALGGRFEPGARPNFLKITNPSA